MAKARTEPETEPEDGRFDSAEMGAIAHLYRGEVYRSTIWRSRLDQTTNWSVVTTGVALSLTFAGPGASPLPLVLVGLLVVVFLHLEARRYRYFNVWRARCRLMETDIFAPILRGQGLARDGRWNRLLAEDYAQPQFHIGLPLAIGRRLRKNYGYILGVQAVAYYGKLVIHPIPLASLDDLFARAAIGPVPGWAVVAAGLVFHGGWLALALATLQVERRRRRHTQLVSIG